MSVVDGNANGMVMPVAPMYGGGYGGGNGFGFCGDGGGLFWLLVLFLFGFAGNGWGNGFGGNGGGTVQIDNAMQRGFDQQSLMTGINGLNNAVTTGFGNIQTALCSGFAGVNQGMANGFAQAEIAANTRQIADMQQNFAAQMSTLQGMNTIGMNLQNCCCQNAANTADLKYTVATEACADRAAVGDALQAVTAQGVANTTALVNTINAGIQTIKDQLCQDKIDAKNEEIANLRTQINLANLAASQNAQTAAIQAGQRSLATEIEQYVNPTAIPAYIVQNPACCNQNFNGCGCA